MRFQQIVQPGSPGSFFKSDLQVSTQSIEKLQNGVGLRLDDTFHHDLAGRISDRNRNAFLVYVHTDIFSAANHERALLSVGVVACTQTLLQKGRPFILHGKPEVGIPGTGLRETADRLTGPSVLIKTSIDEQKANIEQRRWSQSL